ncbi:conditioned medium-induced protein 4 [Halorientalis pallida]|uniref:Conditioned medium-induced protein 4 n=1 Tax=Halorientalis pallida TaxID=2479928 RepID=A0A498KWZ8_9EURY|nr:conditioned medium-induced protein 4 [Halorientalis pallida]RXK50151.1 conditioned medium-induced protein 4 [Halorientalis pallida]
MDEKTEELRDIFVEVTDEETVTERQEEGPGSLADADEAAVADRIAAVVATMRERYDFATDLDDDALVTVVRGFYDGADDAAIAEPLDETSDEVFRARMDLHLLDDEDTAFPFALSDLRDARADADDPDTAALADTLDADPETVERALAAASAQEAIRRVSGRFQSQFEDAIPDAALSIQLTEAAQESGLEEAAEDIETDTKF